MGALSTPPPARRGFASSSSSDSEEINVKDHTDDEREERDSLRVEAEPLQLTTYDRERV
jgi:hypothetical protein